MKMKDTRNMFSGLSFYFMPPVRLYRGTEFIPRSTSTPPYTEKHESAISPVLPVLH